MGPVALAFLTPFGRLPQLLFAPAALAVTALLVIAYVDVVAMRGHLPGGAILVTWWLWFAVHGSRAGDAGRSRIGALVMSFLALAGALVAAITLVLATGFGLGDVGRGVLATGAWVSAFVIGGEGGLTWHEANPDRVRLVVGLVGVVAMAPAALYSWSLAKAPPAPVA